MARQKAQAGKGVSSKSSSVASDSEERSVGGRPRKEINLETLRAVARITPNIDEIAAALEVSPRTVKRRLKEPEFREIVESSRARLRYSSRRAVVAAIERVANAQNLPGDSTILVFHLKQREECGGLAYTDRHEHDLGDQTRSWAELVMGARGGQVEPGGEGDA